MSLLRFNKSHPLLLLPHPSQTPHRNKKKEKMQNQNFWFCGSKMSVCVCVCVCTYKLYGCVCVSFYPRIVFFSFPSFLFVYLFFPSNNVIINSLHPSCCSIISMIFWICFLCLLVSLFFIFYLVFVCILFSFSLLPNGLFLPLDAFWDYGGGESCRHPWNISIVWRLFFFLFHFIHRNLSFLCL